MKETLSVPTGLWCNYLINPLGVESQKPLLGWQITAKQEGWQQSAYQILVASSLELLERDEGDLWDSGKVRSSQSVHISYQGRPLASREMCYWKVRVWRPGGQPRPLEPACLVGNGPPFRTRLACPLDLRPKKACK